MGSKEKSVYGPEADQVFIDSLKGDCGTPLCFLESRLILMTTNLWILLLKKFGRALWNGKEKN